MNTQAQTPEENDRPQKNKFQQEVESMRAIRDKNDAEILKGSIDYQTKGLSQTTADLAEYGASIWQGDHLKADGTWGSRAVVLEVNGQYIPGFETADHKIDLLTDGITSDPEKAREVAESYHYHATYSGPEITPPEYLPSVDKQPMEFIPLEVPHEMAAENAPLEADHARDAEAEWLNDGEAMEPLPSQPLFLSDDEFVRDYGPTDHEDFNREGANQTEPELDDGGGYDIDID
ncbi:hypothetical protein THIX_60985 [Thiomonas sp. X19]|uniref:hypothetical protein n=1 Tax=Thiomonas sp. X19 TaxID=1050370 RepID=UPI000B6CACEA|nr:hypothetical protein [Thiomonas sp. X19]SCC94927.1 hypothetical protein THIX_60985 [Thiomonas sp. X19]